MAAPVRSIPKSAHTNVPSFRLHVVKMMERMIQTDIIPYYILIFIYLTVYSPSLPRPHETVGSAILKILPVWYLVLYVKRRSTGSPEQLSSGVNGHLADQEQTRNVIDNQVSSGHALNNGGRSYLSGCVPCLIVSSVGDVCLVYRDLFLPGVFFFSIVHIGYLNLMRKLCTLSSKAWVALPLCFLLYSIMLLGIDDSFFKVLALVYSLIIHSMLFFAISSYESVPCSSTLCYMLGALVFVTSDFLIACNRWLLATPLSELSILSTYYLAQLLLTIGSC